MICVLTVFFLLWMCFFLSEKYLWFFRWMKNICASHVEKENIWNKFENWGLFKSSRRWRRRWWGWLQRRHCIYLKLLGNLPKWLSFPQCQLMTVFDVRLFNYPVGWLAGWLASFAWFFLQMDNKRAQVRQFLWMVLYEYDVHYRLTKPKASPERIVANEILYSYCFDGHRQTYFVWNEPCEPCADVMGSHMIEIQNGDWR